MTSLSAFEAQKNMVRHDQQFGNLARGAGVDLRSEVWIDGQAEMEAVL
jgi:hypothetical protein